MKKILLILLILGALPWNMMPAEADEAPKISVKAEVDRAFMTIGDPVVYTVTIRYLPGIQVLSSIPPPSADLFKIKKVFEFKEKEGLYSVEGRRFTLTTFRLGEFILDPVKIQYREGAGDLQSVETGKIFLTVRSVVKEGETMSDIRGIKPVVPLPRTFLKRLLYILGVLAFAAALIFFLVMRRKPRTAAPMDTVLTPEEEALMALHDLFDSDFLRRGKYREYFFRFSEILRIFFEKRYRIIAVESTTSEIMRALKNSEVLAEHRARIQDVLEAADLAKFAKWRPAPAEVLSLNERARAIVEQTMKKEASDGV